MHAPRSSGLHAQLARPPPAGGTALGCITVQQCNSRERWVEHERAFTCATSSSASASLPGSGSRPPCAACSGRALVRRSACAGALAEAGTECIGRQRYRSSAGKGVRKAAPTWNASSAWKPTCSSGERSSCKTGSGFVREKDLSFIGSTLWLGGQVQHGARKLHYAMQHCGAQGPG